MRHIPRALAVGSAALDGLGVTTRLKCLLPDFDAQENLPQNTSAGLQISPIDYNYVYAPYVGYYQWLLSKYPDAYGTDFISADGFKPNTDGVFACGEPAVKLGAGFPAGTQLSAVGLTLSDLK